MNHCNEDLHPDVRIAIALEAIAECLVKFSSPPIVTPSEENEAQAGVVFL